MKRVLAIVIFLLLPVVCLAQEAKKIPVAVVQNGEDELGQLLAFEVKDSIRGSQSFRSVDYDIAIKAPGVPVMVPRTIPAIVVMLNTMDLSVESVFGLKKQKDINDSSAIAISIFYYSRATPGLGALLHPSAQLCGRERIKSCASRLLPQIEQAAEYLRRVGPTCGKPCEWNIYPRITVDGHRFRDELDRDGVEGKYEETKSNHCRLNTILFSAHSTPVRRFDERLSKVEEHYRDRTFFDGLSGGRNLGQFMVR